MLICDIRGREPDIFRTAIKSVICNALIDHIQGKLYRAFYLRRECGLPVCIVETFDTQSPYILAHSAPFCKRIFELFENVFRCGLLQKILDVETLGAGEIAADLPQSFQGGGVLHRVARLGVGLQHRNRFPCSRKKGIIDR